MENTTLLVLIITVTLIIIGGFAFMLKQFFNSEKETRNYELRMKYSQSILPQKLQAYERMTLFLERIKPSSLIRRVQLTNDLQSYQYSLIEMIQSEYEHNLAQQLYISPSTWEIIFSAKNATQLIIKEAVKAVGEKASTKELQEEIIKQTLENSPSTAAILYLQKDIQGKL